MQKLYCLRFLPERKFPLQIIAPQKIVLFKFCMNSTNCTDFKPKITRHKIFKISYCKWISYGRANIVQSIEEMKCYKLDFSLLQTQVQFIRNWNPIPPFLLAKFSASVILKGREVYVVTQKCSFFYPVYAPKSSESCAHTIP